MSEAITFCATVDSVAGGDDEVRMVLLLKNSTADLAAAVNMLGKLNRVLRVTAYVGTDADAVAEFRGSIPPIKTGVQFRASKPPVIKLDIPASDATSALRLIGYSERVVRFQVADEGERVGNGKRMQSRPKEPKGAYSYFWEYLHPNGGKGGSGFATLPKVREAIEELRITATEPTWELLHRVFGVETLAGIGPEDVLAKFEADTKVALFVDRAMKFQNEKEAKQQ